MAHMQYIVDRYHSSSISFPTRWQAFEFAMECGDFAGIRVEKTILDRSHFTMRKREGPEDPYGDIEEAKRVRRERIEDARISYENERP